MKILTALNNKAVDTEHTVTIACSSEIEQRRLIRDLERLKEYEVMARTYRQFFEYVTDMDIDYDELFPDEVLKKYDIERLCHEYGALGTMEHICEVESRHESFRPYSHAIEEGIVNT